MLSRLNTLYSISHFQNLRPQTLTVCDWAAETSSPKPDIRCDNLGARSRLRAISNVSLPHTGTTITYHRLHRARVTDRTFQRKRIELYLCNEENGDSSSLASDSKELILRGLPNRDRGTAFALDDVLLLPPPPVLLSGSTLPDLGVTYPPPSTAIGIMYSRGLFRIGSGPRVDPRALSVSESAVD